PEGVGRVEARASPRMYIDIIHGRAAPQVGDFLVSVGKRGVGSAYLVLTCYRVKRRDPKAYPRYQMETEPVEIAAVPVGARTFHFRWYPRKKRKTFEQHMERRLT
ncbi:MAG: hypothetical protein ACRDQZ_09095, partial [Mycobacteriales bacterium]